MTPGSLGFFGQKVQRESSTETNKQIFTQESVDFI